MKKLIDIYNSLNDKPLHEGRREPHPEADPDNYLEPKQGEFEVDADVVNATEKVKIKYGQTTRLKNTSQIDDVTISWGEESHLLNFEEGDLIDDHGNEGKDIIFVAYSEDNKWRFLVDVSVDANFEYSGNIQDVMWDSLEIDVDDSKMPEFFGEQKRPDYADVDGDGDEEESMEKAFKDKENIDEQGCTEEEIREGTCGYSPDGKPRRKPAGSDLLSIVRENIKALKK